MPRAVTPKITMMQLSSIKPYEGNPRELGNAVEGVQQSIREYGFTNPILIDNDGVTT